MHPCKLDFFELFKDLELDDSRIQKDTGVWNRDLCGVLCRRNTDLDDAKPMSLYFHSFLVV